MENLVLKEGEELIVGRAIKTLKGNNEQGWALLMVETDKKEKKIIYAVKNIPNLFADYNFIVTKSTRQSSQKTYILVNYYSKPKEIDREMELFRYLKEVPKVGFAAIDKINKTFTFKGFFHDVHVGKLMDNDYAVFLNHTQKENIYKTYKENEEKILALIGEDDLIDEDLFFFELNKIQNIYNEITKLYPSLKDYTSHFKSNNPYKLFLLNKLPLKDVDTFALALGWSKESFERLEAFLYVTFIKLEENNSTYIYVTELLMALERELSYEVKTNILKDFLNYMVKKEELINENNYICRKEMFLKENDIALTLKDINSKDPIILNSIPSSELKYLSDKQRNAYHLFLRNNITIVTGGPGTGKSNLIKHMHDTFKENGYKYGDDFIVLTPTGRAASNLTVKNKFFARTIHSFLNIPTEYEVVLKDPEEFEKLKFLIIDEFSMVNINIFYLLLKNCSNLQKIIFVGDVDQLPAIGPGDLLHNLIKSNVFAVEYLTENFRSESSEIIEYIHLINDLGNFENEEHNKKVFEYLKNKNIKDLSFELNEFKDKIYPKFADTYANSLKQKNIEMLIYNNFQEDIANLFLEKVKIYGIENAIILCPIYRGNYGIDKINKTIQNAYNPNGQEVFKYKINEQEYSFRVNDKVIQLVNRHEQGIANGDIGYIEKIKTVIEDNKEKEVIDVRFESLGSSKIISYKKDEFKTEIKLAYAVTVHKFQGSEIECAIFVVHPDHSRMLSRKLVYTAASRAIKKLVIFSKFEEIYSKIFLKEFLSTKKIITNLEFMLKE
ncbi:ATP-dependent DNA helicase [Mycoplasmopsis edwardii]|nr:AAA family ATPase [Mycoplasmopsis edwardii]